MQYELITEDDYDSLPEENGPKFVAIEAICRRNMNRLISQHTDADSFDDLLRCQYMMTVSASAHALGVNGIDYPHYADRPAFELEKFMVEVTGAVSRLRLDPSFSRENSVRIAPSTRVELDVQIRRLREIIINGEMSEERRRTLLDRLDKLTDEVAQSRLNLTRAMAIIATISFGVVTTSTSFLADAPDAIATIASLIGQDRDAEEKERERLAGPSSPAALPAPETKKKSSAPPFEPQATSEGDDIPF